MGPKGVIEREKRQKEKEGKRYKGETGTRTDAERKSKLKSIDQGTKECVALRKHLPGALIKNCHGKLSPSLPVSIFLETHRK